MQRYGSVYLRISFKVTQAQLARKYPDIALYVEYSGHFDTEVQSKVENMDEEISLIRKSAKQSSQIGLHSSWHWK